MLKINLSAIPSQSFYLSLFNQNCRISLYQKGLYLYLDLAVEGNIIAKGAICQNGADIIQSPSYFFNGSLHILDMEGNEAPFWEGLGTRFLFFYSEERLKEIAL